MDAKSAIIQWRSQNFLLGGALRKSNVHIKNYCVFKNTKNFTVHMFIWISEEFD